MKKTQSHGKPKRMFAGGRLIMKRALQNISAGEPVEIPKGNSGGPGGNFMGFDMEEFVKKMTGQKMSKGGVITRGDGCAARGKTKGRMI